MKYIFSTSSTASDLGKKLKEAVRAGLPSQCNSRVSITVLANFSTQYLVNSIHASLLFNGVLPEIYESSYDQWEFELNNPDSETYRKNSDHTLLFLSSTRLIYSRSGSPRDFVLNLKGLLGRYKEKCHGEITLVLPESLREGFDQTSIFHNVVKEFRRELRKELEGLVNFLDIDPLIMEFGFEKWHPSKFLTAGKFCCHPNCFPLYGNYLAVFVLSLIRRPTRLVIADLDNTLWHGVVGDVGWDGVGLDADSEGRPHLMLQRYLLSLKQGGVLLAVCSKNSIDVAKKVFDCRREMILKFDDFVAHEISWEPKSEGIKRILNNLNLTETGVMFLDDSKFEREEVKSNLPEIMVPELPENPEVWCEFLSKTGDLTIAKVSEDDLKKTSLYFAERQRKKDAEIHTDYSGFLENLNLVITPQRVTNKNFDRVLELVHKTNQFNLTTRRHTAGELERFASREDVFCYCYSLKDKYSEYGIIAVFIAEKVAAGWQINTWLMSCRAMGRGVENAIFGHFLSDAVTEGEAVLGQYLPTEKNKPISDLLEKMGFIDQGGAEIQAFVVGRDTTPSVPYITVEPSVETM